MGWRTFCSYKKMNIIYAKGSEGTQFNKICAEGTKVANEKGLIRRLSPLKGNLVNLNHIDKPIDIYHCHSAHSLQGIRKAKELGAKVILQRDSTHVETMIEWCEEGNKIWGNKYPESCSKVRERTNLPFQLAEYEEADYILVASKLEEKSFLDKGFSKDKIVRIPFPVDFEKFCPPLDNDKEFSIVLGGGPSVRKGYPEANEACKQAGFKLNIIPSKPRGADFVSQELKKHTVCLAPTREDGHPCLVLESMASGLVPIVSTQNGVAEHIEHGVSGFIVDLSDTQEAISEIAEILIFLKDNPIEMKQIGLEARKSVSLRTWDDYGEDIAKFYEDVKCGK